MRSAKDLLDTSLTSRIIYGVNTGFGPMASHIVGRNDLILLQRNLIRSHAAGMGTPVDTSAVLAAMIIRLNTLAKGHSGASMDVVEQLTQFINHRIIPVVPEHGAVGTSGDLVQLAHIALALIGEGEVFFKGTRMPTAKAMKRVKLAPLVLGPKEGLTLINGTSGMTGIATHLCHHAERIISLALRSGAWSLDLVDGFDDSISERLQAVRPHNGQRVVAAAMRALVAKSKRLKSRKSFRRNTRFHPKSKKLPKTSKRCIRCGASRRLSAQSSMHSGALART